MTALGGGLFRITADVENAGLLPTALAQGVTARFREAGDGPARRAAGVDRHGLRETSFIPALAGSGNRQSYEWVVTGKPGATVTLKAVSQKGGTDTATLTLK